MKAMKWMMALMAVLAACSAVPVQAAEPRCTAMTRVGRGPGLFVYGLSENQWLVRFRECRPERLDMVGSVVGFQSPDTALVGIDFRVQDGQLYGVGNGGGIYTIDPDTAVASKVSQLTVALNGTSFGVDFNPAADRLRIVSDAGQNLRHNVNAGGVTLTDGALNYTAGVAAAGITGAAYTNNDLDSTTGTTLFDIDTALNQVVIQSPPNAGSLAATGQLPVDPESAAGFDIFTSRRKGMPADNDGFASLIVGGVSGFYRINILTGEASLIGLLDERLIDVAIPIH